MNIVLITVDQLRWDFYNQRTVTSLRTPAITRLMNEGVTFSQAWSNCPICMPTRFTWMYGLYASQGSAMLLRNAADWPEDLPSMPQALQQAGYHTALIGKLHSVAGLYRTDLTDPSRVDETRRRGFDHVHEVSGKSLSFWFECNWTHYLQRLGLLDAYRADIYDRGELTGGMGRCDASILPTEHHMDSYIARQACQWIDRAPTEGPVFLHVSFCGPHFPLDPPAEYLDRHDPADMPAPEGVDDPELIDLWKRRRASYAALIEHVDDQISAVLDALGAHDRFKDAMILFANDHGDMMGHLGLGHKCRPQDTSSRTPIILCHRPTLPAGVVRDTLAEAVDLPATILDAAGLDDIQASLPGTPGRSLLPAARDNIQHRDCVFSECGLGENAWQMLRDRQYKYVFNAGASDEFYDCQADPWELTNLIDAPDQQQRISTMRQTLISRTIHAPARRGRSEAPIIDNWWLRDHPQETE